MSVTSPSVIKWLPNSSFNLPANFKDGKLPCSKNTVIFPKSLSGSVGLESVMDMGALILPNDGEIVLENAVIELGKDLSESNCSDGNSYYLDKSTSAWTQAGVWSSSKFNDATPDTEKIPCYDDVVEFPANTKYTVRLPNERQVIHGIKIGNDTYSTQSFRDYIDAQSDQMGQFVLNDYIETGVTVKGDTTCQESFGCPCQTKSPKIDCTVKYCPQPTCVAPIKPEGYCCSFCGGYITFNIDEGFDMISFKELVGKITDMYGNELVFHIGFTSITPDRKIQLVIVEKGDYNGNSAEAINIIDNNVANHWYRGEKLAQISGSPLSKKGLSAKISVSMFFVVVFVLGAIYLYYYKLPTVTFAVGGEHAWPGAMFSRFKNRSDSVVSLTRRDSTAATSRTAFRNPLYDSKRQRVLVEETSVEEE